MANLSNIITPTNVLTATSTNTVTNKTIAFGSNTLTDIAGTTATQTLTNKTINIANNTLTGVQPTLVSGTNIKTINGGSVLGSGNLVIGGGMTLLATITPTAAANVDFLNTFSSAYDCYLITCTGVTPASYTSSPGPLIRVATGGVVDTTSLYNGFFQSGGSATSSAQLNTNQTNSGPYSFQLFVANANTTSNVKYMTMQLQYSPNGSANDPTGLFYTGAYRGTSAISGLRIYWSNGTNFTATGRIRVYGYNNT
jgi:hypothetical protein